MCKPLFLIIAALLAPRPAPADVACPLEFAKLETPPKATMVKLRKDGTHIYRVEKDGKVFYYREEPLSSGAIAYEKSVFDNPEMPAVAYRATKGLPVEGVVPEAEFQPGGMNVLVDGKVVRTRPGALQAEIKGIVTPIDIWKKLHPGREPSAHDIEEILNQGDWPRQYANWKIFWRIFGQADRSIENLGVKDGQLVVFDLGDAFNLHPARASMGITRDIDNLTYNMPNKPWDIVEFRADFRKADPAFKNMARIIATESDEATAGRLGKTLAESFPHPRGSVRAHVAQMKEEARRILELLNKAPFDY